MLAGVVPRSLLLGLFSVAALSISAISATTAAAVPCQPGDNEVTCENRQPGNPESQWDVSGGGNPDIQGFATDISLDQGQTVHFKVDTAATAYHLDIYRMGYYAGDGARLVATVQPTGPPDVQPACLTDGPTGLTDCGNWTESASWAVPANAVSGIYFAKLVRDDVTAPGSHIFFIVRDDDGNSDLLFQTQDTTWEAYNQYGGNSLYVGGPGTNPGRAYKVSYNRPLTVRGPTPEDSPFNAEYPMVRWLERNGYDVSYFTGVDADRFGPEILDHQTYLSVGHDEYWSAGQRANVTATRDLGVNLAFFSGNESFWKTRWENSIDGSNTDHRTLVSYKETHAGAKIDPTSAWTGTWRDVRGFNPEGPNPENGLTGTMFRVNSGTSAIEVPAADGKMRLWRDTSIASLAPNTTATLTGDTLGYEWDEAPDNSVRPPGLVYNSSTTRNGVDVLQDNGSTFAPGTATHHLTLYRDTNGPGPDALVFGAGTIQWSWGLDGNHERGSSTEDPRMQQATVNLLADMEAQPQTIQGGLTAATPSTDTDPPASAIAAPIAGSNVESGQPTTVSGIATDAVGETAGGQVGAVEVSTDGGSTWHPADGRDNWIYTWTPGATGSATIMARAADDSGNLESPGDSVTVNVVPRTCPCSIWSNSFTAPGDGDNNAVEVGVKFRSDQAGYITGLRFYKTPGNTGTHIGHLWTAGGTQLAEATFTGETGSGWQQVSLNSPVAIRREHHLRRLVSRAQRQLRLPQQLLQRSGRRQRAPARTRRRRRRVQRHLQLRGLGGAVPESRELPGEQLLGGRRLRDHRRAGHDPADGQRAHSVERRQRRQHRHGRNRHLQRGDGPRHDRRQQRGAARTGQLAGRGGRQLQPRPAAGDARPDQPASELHRLHGDGEGRPHRPPRQGPRRKRAGGRLDLVVHDCRAAAASAQRGSRRADPGDHRTPATPSAATTPRSCAPRASTSSRPRTSRPSPRRCSPTTTS